MLLTNMADAAEPAISDSGLDRGDHILRKKMHGTPEVIPYSGQP